MPIELTPWVSWAKPTEPITFPWTPVVPRPTTYGATYARSGWLVYRILYRLQQRGVELHPDKCWLWPYARNAKGYARMGRDSEGETYVHRAMYRETRGPIPAS